MEGMFSKTVLATPVRSKRDCGTTNKMFRVRGSNHLACHIKQ